MGTNADNGDVDVSRVVRVGSKPFGKKAASDAIVIPGIETAVMEIGIVGTSDLYIHQFPVKVQREIAEKQEGKAQRKRAPKDPFDEFRSALYILNESKVPKKRLKVGESWPYVKDTFGVKASAFKKALMNACKFLDGVSVSLVGGAIHVLGNMIPIVYDSVELVMDPVRVGPFKKADMRYRPLFKNWSVKLQVRFNCRLFTMDQIANLFENAGFHVGVGDWRPQKSGSFGTFAVERKVKG